jgi:hypothetical protein
VEERQEEATALGRAATAAMAAAACTLGFAGVGFARTVFGLGSALVALNAVRRRRMPAVPRVATLASAFVLSAVLATLWGVDPARGAPALHKLLPWLFIPLFAAVLTTPPALRSVLKGYALGQGILALRTFHTAGRAAWDALRDGATFHPDAWRVMLFHGHLPPDQLIARLVNCGDMQDAQRFLVGLLLTAGLLAGARRAYVRLLWIGLLALQGAALLLTFKRGAMLAALIGFAVYAGIRTGAFRALGRGLRAWPKRNWAVLLAALLAGAGLFAVSPAAPRLAYRARHAVVREALRGRRLCMWLVATPKLARRHPWGMGFKVLRSEDMRAAAPRVEPHHDHVHSNPLQILIATGWIGLALYFLWMAQALSDAAAFTRRALRRAPAELPLAAALCAALVALMLNGLVEYQFGAGQVVLLYVLLMAANAAGRRRLTAGA